MPNFRGLWRKNFMNWEVAPLGHLTTHNLFGPGQEDSFGSEFTLEQASRT